MKIWGVVDCLLALVIFWGGAQYDKKWVQFGATAIAGALFVVGCACVLNSFC